MACPAGGCVLGGAGVTERRTVATAEDADSIREDIESVHDGCYAEGPIDWDDFLYRLEGSAYDLGDSLLSPAIRRIKAIVRELRRQSE